MHFRAIPQIKKILEAIRDSGGTLIYVLHTGKRGANGRSESDASEVTHLDM